MERILNRCLDWKRFNNSNSLWTKLLKAFGHVQLGINWGDHLTGVFMSANDAEKQYLLRFKPFCTPIPWPWWPSSHSGDAVGQGRCSSLSAYFFSPLIVLARSAGTCQSRT